MERKVKSPIADGSRDEPLLASGATEPFNICLCCDRRYLQHAAVTIVSILENNPHENICVFLLLTEELSEDDLKKLTGTLEKYRNCQLHMINIAVTIAAGNLVPSRVSNATFGRLWIEHVVPDTVQTILYLDSDIVVCGALRPLFDLNISEYLAAAVPDHWEQIRPELGFTELGKYVNAGTLLLNLARWRNEKISQKIKDYIVSDAEKIRHGDQDAINAVLMNKILFIGMEWNYQVALLRSGIILPQGPKIVHYSASTKPWMYGNAVAYKSLYNKYLAKTMWQSYVAPDFSRAAQVKLFFRRLVLAGLVLAGRRSHEW